jgi:hypothetical protein
VVPLYGDMHLSLVNVFDHSPHFDKVRRMCSVPHSFTPLPRGCYATPCQRPI